MYNRGNKRAGLVARCIMALTVVVGIAALAFGVYSIRNKPAAVPVGQVIPAEAAKRAGALPRPAPRPN